jgi:hypothetical protein
VGDSSSRSFMGALNPTRSSAPNMEQKILQSGKVGGGYGGAGYDRSTKTKATKRSVSETKKKYVASMQDWRCGDCRDKLNAWFEVDHKVRLEYGGGNDVGIVMARRRRLKTCESHSYRCYLSSSTIGAVTQSIYCLGTIYGYISLFNEYLYRNGLNTEQSHWET